MPLSPIRKLGTVLSIFLTKLIVARDFVMNLKAAIFFEMEDSNKEHPRTEIAVYTEDT